MNPGKAGLVFHEPLLFELGGQNKRGVELPEMDLPIISDEELLGGNLRQSPNLPELSEPEVVRHFTRLSQWNYSLDGGFYPLGSCTMKYNPKMAEVAANLDGFAQAHPYAPHGSNQGLKRLLFELQNDLAEISGMDTVCLHPAAGSHGELLGLMLIRAYHNHRGDSARTQILIPDSAHGTNPSSASICHLDAITLPSGPDGLIDLNTLDQMMNEKIAGIMITNPNTCGLFEERIKEVCDLVHARGGLVYLDGANMNAMVGVTRPGDFGADVLHFNTHKTFATPHGGGGPGAGPVGVKAILEPFLPKPVLVERNGKVEWNNDRPRSIGKVRSFYGNVGVLIRAWTYIRSLGPKGLRQMTLNAVTNANYLKALLEDHFEVPFKQHRAMHEVLLTDKRQKENHVSTLDLAKGLIEAGYHPPTIYFPLVVEGAMLIEPTETESKETLDQFAQTLIELGKKGHDELAALPKTAAVGRVDEVLANRKPILRWEA
ncbi:MAG: glycine dehydrogenase (aminomethyl-transferring) [Candidatus Lambdaproteobacteria bacterium RIFOXYD2_FULL_50_16]|uniref:glycine dehydrogenase (aminomethyl-transferring) n=1 Tax=Candidatus Lambdaproteobacteria bacterium RIFOXYD2_FULL_50_16 TaxID=1817772 RepID=A0A1F6GB05_9PROT|nr:MAG: glycine dehydrogenase (aminomethyl-transferring) [Candidatus Lambdaproteobacteria bacterium RIFOXYD2_FULL_50_16]